MIKFVNIKKLLSFVLSLIIILNSLNLNQFVFATFDVTSFKIKNLTATTYSLNPGDRFSIDMIGSNTLPDSIKEVYANIKFGSNTGFSYGGIDQRTRIGTTVVTNPVPSSAYSSLSGFRYEITNSSNSSILATTSFEFSRASNNYTGFVVMPDISTYSNTVTSWFDGKKVLDNSAVVGTTITRTIYANVRPHIVDYYFEKQNGTTTNQIQGGNMESINLVLKIKDYNGCTNIDGGNIFADLSQIGLSNNESLTYQSCDADGKTAIFKKLGVSTVVSIGTYNFDYTKFTAVDENNNINTPNDPNTTFDDEDKKSSVGLTVVAATAPNVSLISLSDNYIGGTLETYSNLQFSGSQNGETKISLGSDGSCVGGTVLKDWSSTGSYIAGSTESYTIQLSSLASGNNTIYACVRNSDGNIGSISVSIIRDDTVPVLTFQGITPASVTTNNATVTFKCSKDGFYSVEVGGIGNPGTGIPVDSFTTTTANTSNTSIVLNSSLSTGSNTVYLYCKDKASNLVFYSGAISKIEPSPSMTGQVMSFADNDFDYDGLDGRDLSINWSTQNAVNYQYFESYRLYLLPSNIDFNSGTQNYISIVADKNQNIWTGTSSLLKDSTNADLISGASYKMCIAVIASNGSLGEAGCSSPATLISDVISHPVINSARFTSGTNIELTANSALDSSVANNSGSLVSFQIGASTYTGIGVSSTNSNKINITIPDIKNISATGFNLILGTGAIRANGGGFNNYFSSGTLIITDGQIPTFTGFSTGTVSAYSGFYTGNISVNYILGETMSGGINTYIQFIRSGGNIDNSVRYYYITSPSDLSSGSHTINVNLQSLGLITGAYYDIQVVGKDLAGNQGSSSTVSSVKYDSVGPDAPILNTFSATSSTGFMFTWGNSVDNGGFGAGVKTYNLRIYNGTGCSVSFKNLTSSTTGLFVSGFSNGTYSWNVVPVDNLNLTGTASSCSNFIVDTTLPVITNTKITDIVLNSFSYTKSGNGIKISAGITNTDINHIWLDMSSLAGSSNFAYLKCGDAAGSVSCSYSGGVVTYSFIGGFSGSLTQGTRHVQFTVQNPSGFNTGTSISSITVDNTAPSVGSVITSPTSSTIWGGTSQNITWNSAGITDNLGLSYLKFEYSTGAHTNWISIGTGSNNSPYSWDISSIPSGSGYQIRISAYDFVGNSGSTVSQSFAVDKVAPIIPSDTITVPNGNAIYSGGQHLNIIWNSGSVTDNIGLASSPVSLEYSTDGGTSWTSIAANLPNSGSYSWTIPSINNTQVKIKLIVTDNAGNTSYDISDNNFIIDSINPVISVSYAGAGGSTPVNGKYINNSGIQATLGATDTYMDKVYYKFQNVTDNLYWDMSSNVWTSAVVSNNICTDNTVLGTASNCGNITSNIVPSGILNGKTYRLTFRAVDEGGNSISANPVDYIGDTSNPLISLSNLSGSYMSGYVYITGSSSDTGAGISSVKIEIKKGNQWWDGSVWTGGQQLLSVTTSNSYSTWSYNFASPIADSDGQEYTIIAYAYDNAYQISNSSSVSVNIIKDITGPFIQSDIFTFNTGILYSGGIAFNVTWNPGFVSSTGADIGANPIILQYNFTGIITTIASNLSNNGSYSFILPAVDATNARLIISARDSLGNLSNAVSSQSFTIDSNPPSLVSAESIDSDADGQIDSILLTFSENILDSSVNIANFSIAGGITITSFDTASAPNDNIIKLNFSNTGNTSTTPVLSYVQGSLTDPALNKLLSFSNRTVSDSAAPRISTSEIFDNNSNGKVDQIKVYFSENLSSSNDLSAWTLNNALPGASVSSVYVSGSIVLLNLSESSNIDTTTGGMSVSFVANSNWKDLSNNQAASLSNINIIDKAKPVFISAVTYDTNGNYKLDKIVLTLSENITGFNSSNFSINGLAAGSSVSSSNLENNTVIFNINETSNDNDTSITGSLVYIPGILQDFSLNNVNGYGSFAVNNGISPKIIGRDTVDSNGNGKIDMIKITFSENVNNIFTGFTSMVNGYVVNGYSGTSSSNVMYILLNELNIYDGADTPQVKIFSNSTLKDLNGNGLVVENSFINASDKVAPVIIGARFDESNNRLYMTFSEHINEGGLSSSSFVLSGAGSSVVSTVNIGTSGDSYADVLITSPSIVYGTSSVSFASNSVQDLVGNKYMGRSFADISASVVINEIMWSNTGSYANQYIELRNLSASSISINGWIVQNAGGNGVDITLPNVNIAGNGYYLIARSSSSSSLLNVTPDFVSSSMNLSISQNDLALKKGSIIIDKARIAFSPLKGDNVTPKSMERIVVPVDGTLPSDWYTSEYSSGFDNLTPKGTPGGVNVFDGYAPFITSSSPASDILFPSGNLKLIFNYSDNTGGLGVDSSSRSLQIQKYISGSGWTGISMSYVSSSGADVSSAYYNLKGIGYGKYRAIFNVKDFASNQSSNDIVQFYVDQFTFSVSNEGLNLGQITVGTDKITSTGTVITVKTIGAGYDISLSHTGMYAGTAIIPNYSGTMGFGYTLSGTSLNPFTGNTYIIGSSKNYTGSEGILHTYTYTVKYGTNISSSQAAGIYKSIIQNKVNINY